MKLYELTEAYKLIEQLIENEDGDYIKALNDIKEDFNTKVINTAKVIRTIELEKEAYLQEAKRLTERANTKENTVSRLKEYVKHNMEILGIEKISGDVFTIALQNNPPSVYVPDESKVGSEWKKAILLPIPKDKLPEEMYDYVKTFDIDKAGILKMHKETNSVPEGIEIVVKKHLRIR